MIISNYKQVATSPARKKVLSIFDKAIKSVATKKIMKESISIEGDDLVVRGEHFSIKNRRIFVVGLGKISAHMALALEEILGVDKIIGGVVISPSTAVSTKKIKIFFADHPIPSKRSLAGAQAIRSLKKQFAINEKDLIIGLVSGGGSSLAVLPVSGVSLQAKQKMTKLLLECGASGYDNTRVKAVLSGIKGGALAVHFAPTPIVSLVISDDNGLAGHYMTASGPFSAERPKFSEALDIILKYNLINKVPKAVLKFLHSQENKLKIDSVTQFILLDNLVLLEEIKFLAKKAQLLTEVHGQLQGNVREVAKQICKTVQSQAVKKPKLYIFGGETTVALGTSYGVGGRNQELVAACLYYCINHPVLSSWCLASIATDGVDCLKDSSGGIVDLDSVKKLKVNDLSDSLLKHNTHPFLKSINSNLVIREETATSLSDVILCLVSPAKL